MHHLPVCGCTGGPSLELEGVYICCMEYCVTLDGFAVILSDGRLGFITPLSNTITVDVRTLSHTHILPKQRAVNKGQTQNPQLDYETFCFNTQTDMGGFYSWFLVSMKLESGCSASKVIPFAFLEKL